MIDIAGDIKSLVSDMREFRKSIKKYEDAIVNEGKNQNTLKKLVENPGEYDIDALKKNVDDCDKNIILFKETIEKERTRIRQHQFMINTLEKRLYGDTK